MTSVPGVIVSVYILIYMFPFPLDRLPATNWLMSFYNEAVDQLSATMAGGLFGISVSRHEFTGSGDGALFYMRSVLIALLAVLTTVVLVLSGRVTRAAVWLSRFVRVYARYFVGIYMIYYGFAKIFDGQFAVPSYGKLEQPLGQSSPMGLLWTFMGASKPYTVFTGLLELTAGYLLLFRSTKILGAIITLAIVINIAMLNLCYDVPVKLFSLHLVVICLFILAPDTKDLYRFFILKRPVELRVGSPVLNDQTTRIVFKSVAIGGITLLNLLQYMWFSFSGTSGSAIDGAYIVQSMTLDGDTIDAPDDGRRWKRLTVSRGYLRLVLMNDSSRLYRMTADTLAKKLSLTPEPAGPDVLELNYSELDGLFRFGGVWNAGTAVAITKKRTYSDYPLMNRGFHWISENPYNR